MTNRRGFIKKSVLGTAGITLGGMGFSAKSYASIIGANNRLNMAVIGFGGRGADHIDELCAIKDSANVHILSLCDADEKFHAKASQTVFDKTGIKPQMEWDMRKVFENRDIHAVTFATPDHWHALGTIWACQAGKHVYVEKPCSHSVLEGRKMIEAARKYNIRVQVGFQNRSGKDLNEAMQFIHNGGIGDVYMVRGLCIKPRDSFGIAKDSIPPASLHYDMWLGPAPWRAYNEKRGHYNWHWFWDTGNGDTANQGPHQFDAARWGLNKNEHPVSVYSSGGLFGIDPKECAQETPNTQTTVIKYADGKIIQFETRGRYSNDESSIGIRIGNIFYGTEGYVELNGENARPWKAFRKRETIPFAGSDEGKTDPIDPTFMLAPSGTEHFTNFVRAIRAEDDSMLNSDIHDGNYSTALAHLANISYRLGRELRFMGEYEKFINDPEADLMLKRTYRYPYIVPDEV